MILLFMISIFGFGHEMLLTGLSLYYISLTVKVVCYIKEQFWMVGKGYGCVTFARKSEE